MTNMVVVDSTLESLTASVNAPLVTKLNPRSVRYFNWETLILV
jgi:hypothetical protein